MAVGVCEALNRTDYITSTHRGHGHCLAKGAAPNLMFAELLGKEAGYCKGKGGSMHIADPDTGNLGANAIVGGGAGIATGAAFSAKYLGDEPGGGLLLRRRRARPRRALRGDEPCAALEAAGDLRVREQPLQRVHALFRIDGGRHARAAEGLWHCRGGGGRSGRAGGTRSGDGPGRAGAAGRRSGVPVVHTYRYRGHHVGDIAREYYRPKQEEQELDVGARSDHAARRWLIAQGSTDQAGLDRIQSEVAAEMDAAVEFAHQRAVSRSRQGWSRMCMPETAVEVRELTFGEAIREALAEEMRRDARIVLLGEDVAEAGTTFKVLKGLVDEFGTERIIDTPISEAGFTGLGVGAAMTGLRPVVDIMFGDFLALVMDQVVNQAAKMHYMSGGKLEGADGDARDDGRDAPIGGAALAVAARVAEPRARAESRDSLDALRCQGTPQDGDP